MSESNCCAWACSCAGAAAGAVAPSAAAGPSGTVGADPSFTRFASSDAAPRSGVPSRGQTSVSGGESLWQLEQTGTREISVYNRSAELDMLGPDFSEFVDQNAATRARLHLRPRRHPGRHDALALRRLDQGGRAPRPDFSGTAVLFIGGRYDREDRGDADHGGGPDARSQDDRAREGADLLRGARPGRNPRHRAGAGAGAHAP